MIPSLSPHLTARDLLAFLRLGSDQGSAFEAKLCETFKTRHALTFYSGRAGLYNILKANKIENKSVLITAYTCCVVTEAIIQSGNRPILVDTQEGSFNAEISEKLFREHENNLGAIIVTNLFGIADFSNSEGLRRRPKGVLLILDDALSPGHVPLRNSDLYDYIYISSGVRKPFSCLGGGMVFTDDDQRFEVLRHHVLANRRPIPVVDQVRKFLLSSLFFIAFRPLMYDVVSFIRRNTSLLGMFFSERNHDVWKACPEYDLDMFLFQKRIGMNQLNKLHKLLEQRATVGDAYFRLLSTQLRLGPNYLRPGTSYSHMPFLHPRRDELEQFLLHRGIDVERYFDYAISDIEAYRAGGGFPNARYVANNILNLPMSVELDEKKIEVIVGTIREFDARLSS